MPTWNLEAHDAVAVLTFDRPPRNVMTLAAAEELADLLESVAARVDEFRIVLLTGAADGYFIAHADIHDLAKVGRGDLQPSTIRGFDRVLGLLDDIPQPSIAAINGQAWGGGSEIALACSLRIASARANIGQPEVRIGLIPGARGTRRLQQVIGSAAAHDAILRGRVFGADEALRLGWVSDVLPEERFREAAIAWAANIAKHPGEALFAAKEALRAGLRLSGEDHARIERKLFLDLLATSETFARRAAQEPAE